ncbi:hypothetical protein ADUPG1_010118 [Aduncisulcus paluster]|uniref:Uncharacterized protein n=1 Tax=Aduncisulcus paluster TaxID=2918883 RepID=A0ABQ5L010_9EUKA|nr:hypothetical protein ADUPG1_010118 [Aduncisulcus paluster]
MDFYFSESESDDNDLLIQLLASHIKDSAKKPKKRSKKSKLVSPLSEKDQHELYKLDKTYDEIVAEIDAATSVVAAPRDIKRANIMSVDTHDKITFKISKAEAHKHQLTSMLAQSQRMGDIIHDKQIEEARRKRIKRGG